MWLWILSGIMALVLPSFVKLLRSSRAVAAFINGWPWLRRQVSNLVIHINTASTPPRPNPHSLWTPPGGGGSRPDWAVRNPGNEEQGAQAMRDAAFVSWEALTNRSYVDRHLPPAAKADLPTIEALTQLFLREPGAAMRRSGSNSVFLGIFAQWFTDSFLRTDPNDLRRTTATHEIDFCQIYGLNDAVCHGLRLGEGGLLRSRMTNTGEYPELLLENGVPRPVFAGFGYCQAAAPGGPLLIDAAMGATLGDPTLAATRRAHLYATGLERGSSNVGYAAVSTLFLREHNRLARAIQAAHRDWGDDRIFEAARNTVIAIGLKIVIEDYIVQIAGTPIRLKMDPGFAAKQSWNRTNRIAVEFNLLYRWHSMVPDEVVLDGTAHPFPMLQFNNAMLEEFGLERLIDALSRQPAGWIGVGNVPRWLEAAEHNAHAMSRRFALAGMNDYRQRFGLKRLASFEELTDDPVLRLKLSAMYGGRIDAVELLPGLFAEGDHGDASFGSLLLRMVGYDAFSQALTNPLLAPQLWNEATFSDIGWAAIHATDGVDDVFRRNTGATAAQRASFGIIPER